MTRILAVLIPLLAIAPFVSAEEPIRERIEWSDVWVTDAEKSELPRVLMIGDSITRGYFSEVEKHLSGKAYCARLTTSKCVCDPFFPEEVQLLLKQYDFDVIHFNNGLHGWGYTEEQYREGLLRLMETFEKSAPKAKLVWATTTPVREAGNVSQISERTNRVKTRNEIAGAIMQQKDVLTNDLFGLVEQHPDWHSGDGTHFNAKGKGPQAAAVAEAVLKCLATETADSP